MAEPTRDRLQGLKVAVTGASGNVGTALLRRLTAPDSGVAEVRGLVRRNPAAGAPYDDVRWHLADLGETRSEDVLARFLDGVDAVVHLAWALQPGRQPERLHRVNVDGTRRLARAAAAAGVSHFVHMSSLGAYAAGAGGRKVAEDWPTTGIPSAQYSRDKSQAELVVREVFGSREGTTLTVVRPTLVLQPEAGSEIGRYFLGPLLFGAARLLPGSVARLLPLTLPSVHVQFVHADDVADALERMLDRHAAGPFNLAAEPVLDADAIARTFGTVRVPVPAFALRTALSVAFHAHLVPTEPGWLDIGTQAPALDTSRARRLLDWAPSHKGDDVLEQFVAALGRGEGAPGPLLHPAGGPERDPGGDPANTPGPRAN
ncbi:NAD-dependent epimerase/dehydratase family protein [Geodermatophilus sp. DF01-2]|uniref:NAD-dependent epimerase/dehydratase family protein n=1 Tax=Geodermatophilus sp. DF01-2 TaxID=2559610 RepID=UPI00107306A8|nr:NAD-dependent epimerase/dehydratase family protein [Geodermatophilus sp. DF01_2]TFV64513.1 NAD-dependent epimerase/dehydratase family protein [Geodermatophilus sp. DF01_2]